MRLIKKSFEIENALSEYHTDLASTIFREVEENSFTRIVEIGSGSGTFTMPLLEVLGNSFETLFCIDSYTGPYKHDKKTLQSKLVDRNFGSKVKVIEKDIRDLGTVAKNVDLIIGHEVLCDLNSELVEQVMATCYNSLNNDGMFIHSEFSPFALNRAEELLHKINDSSEDPISNTTWFSPSADELGGIAYKVGFRSINVSYQKILIKFMKNAAFEMVGRWKTKDEFLQNYSEEIEKIGIEYPMEQILYCIK